LKIKRRDAKAQSSFQREIKGDIDGDKGRSFLERSEKRPNVLLVGASLVDARGYACITFSGTHKGCPYDTRFEL